LKTVAPDPLLDAAIDRIKNSRIRNIGKQPVNWSGGKDAVLNKLTADFENESLGRLSPGPVTIVRRKHGIRIYLKSFKEGIHYDIHFAQIIEVKERTAQEMVETNGSVIGRGIVGGVALGPAGAIVGALSAMKPAQLKRISVIKLSFCDRILLTRKEVFFRTNNKQSKIFWAKVRTASYI